MTIYKTTLLSVLVLLGSCSSDKGQEVVSLADSSLSSIFEQLMEKPNPFEFYTSVYENFRFELKSTVIQSNQTDEAPPLESLSVFESNDEDGSRFFKRSLDPISEVEWKEKEGKDYIRYDDSKNFLRTSYNPVFEKWKKGIFQDIQSVFNLSELEKNPVKSEKNAWSCFESSQQKLCVDSKTGLPIFGKAIKQIKPETAVSMVFTLNYGQDSVPEKKEPEKKEPAKKTTSKQTPKKRALPKKK